MMAVSSKKSVAFRNDISNTFMSSVKFQINKNAIPVIHAALLYPLGFVENTSKSPPINNIIANIMQI